MLVSGGAYSASASEVSPKTPPVSSQFLAENEVSGQVVNVQTDPKGAKLYLYDSGDFVLVPPAPKGGGVSTQAFNAGACAGTFVRIVRLSNQLYWGGQENCATTRPGGAYVHKLRVVLRKACIVGICFQVPTRDKTSTDSPYNNVQTVNGFENCISASQQRYDMVAYPTVRSVQYGRFVDTSNYVVGCNIS